MIILTVFLYLGGITDISFLFYALYLVVDDYQKHKNRSKTQDDDK